jgi:excisionase family DNA binding protein
MESMMTARQVAELLGVHENWVYDQAASGQLPSYKIGGARRFDPDELRGWIAEHREAERLRRPTQRAAAPGAGTSRGSRREDRMLEPERPKGSSRRRARQAADDSREAQPRLFET